MDIKVALEAIAGRLQATSVRTVYGDPVTAHGRTVIPVARVAYGFGCGGGQSAGKDVSSTGAAGESAGGGGGVVATPAGIVEVTPAGTRFVGTGDWRWRVTAAAIGFAVGVALSRWARGR